LPPARIGHNQLPRVLRRSTISAIPRKV
jgi:hypothetical protein